MPFHIRRADTRATFLQISTAPPPSTVSKEESAEEQKVPPDDEFLLPWSKFQEWALRDNLPRYVVTISIPSKKTGGSSKQNKLHALWRTMAREVTELSGYPIDMLQQMHTRQLKDQEEKNGTALTTTPDSLPLLDEFEFSSSGGLSGRVYGIPGVADGTKVETTVVRDVQITVPKGYVQTEDGAVAYELGTPLRDFYSLGGISGSRVRDVSNGVAKTATGFARGAMEAGSSTDEDPDSMLVRLGAFTAILLAGATAVNLLSHHLTVNVFWV